VRKWPRRILWLLAILFASPAVPIGIASWATWERKQGRPVLTRFPAFVGTMSTPGRIVFFTVAFIGGELVAIDLFVSTNFDAVDEHAASILGVYVLVALTLVVTFEYLMRHLVAAVRDVSRRRGSDSA
jgi:hypothetical protein